MKNYFAQFPRATYTLPSGLTFTSDDLSIRFAPIASIAGKYLTKYSHRLRDIDRPDIVARDYYGHADFAWLVLISGGLSHYLNDFPLDNESLDAYIEDKYGMSIETAMATTKHQVDADGDIVDVGAPVSIYDYEFQKNEATRHITLISRKYIPEIVKEMDEFFRTVKKGL
jgi:uncharacterized NAD(P)/FAD-binding protein YdhS